MNIVDRIKLNFTEYIHVFAFSGLGDICYCLSVINGIKRKFRQKVLVITREYSAPLVKLFEDVDGCIVLNESEIEEVKSTLCLKDYQIAFGKDRGKNGIFSCEPLTYEAYAEFLPGMNYFDYLRNQYLNENESIAYPFVPKKGSTAIAHCNRVVVINPFSNTLDSSHYGVFEKIAFILKEKGYEVYTNVIDEQKPISGTKALRCCIEEFYRISRDVAVVISIRTGLIDFSISSGGNFMVLYDNTWNGSFKTAYGLDGWKPKGRICELSFDEEENIFKTLDSFLK